MATYQYRVNWSGTTGGPGVSVFSARAGTATNVETFTQYFADSVRKFFTGFSSSIPNEVTLSFPAEVQAFNTSSSSNDPAGGQLEAVYPVTPPASITGGSTTGYAHASGVRIDWLTEAIVNGRRLRGRTYIVPVQASVFGTDGRVTAASVTAYQNAANTLISDLNLQGSLAVWSRTHGILADVQSAKVPTLGAVLRSRRD